MKRKQTPASVKYDINKPWLTLDPWQKKYIGTEGNCFILCGRQSGKSAAASIKFGKRAATKKNRAIYMLAYTEKQAYNLFFKTLMYLKECHPKLLITKGNKKPTKHIIHLTNGSQIFCYAVGLTGEGIRGPTATDLVIDEAAPMAREVFVAISPMLSVTKGNMDILSTPRGTKDKDGRDTFFFQCSKDPTFEKFYVSAEDCPRHSQKFLKEQRKSMSELEYAQEYLAKFLDDIRRIFPDALLKKTCILKRRQQTMSDRTYYYGCDVARRDKDEFTHEILDATYRDNIQQVESIVTKNIPIPENTRRAINLNYIFDFKKMYIDSGGMGITVCDLLRENDNTKRKVVEINNASRKYPDEDKEISKRILKEELYENLKMLMEQDKIKLLDDDEVIHSLASVQFTIQNGKTKIFGNYTHIAEGLIRAAWGAKDKSLNIYIY